MRRMHRPENYGDTHKSKPANDSDFDIAISGRSRKERSGAALDKIRMRHRPIWFLEDLALLQCDGLKKRSQLFVFRHRDRRQQTVPNIPEVRHSFLIRANCSV